MGFYLRVIFVLELFAILGCDGSFLPPPTDLGTSQNSNCLGLSAPTNSCGQLNNSISLGKSDSGYVFLPLPSPANTENARSPLAVNIGSLRYYARQWLFVDLLKRVGSFNYNAKPGATDSNGWVLDGDVGLYLMVGLEGHYPGGQYIVLYDGEGQFNTTPTFYDPTGKKVTNDAVLNSALSKPGRLVLDITPTNAGIVLSYTPNPSDPVKNLRIVHSKFELNYQDQLFHPAFINKLKKFNTLRFMDVMDTNGSKNAFWSQRRRPQEALQASGSRGLALEYLIELSNRVHANAWFNIPHLADDDYVRNFAIMVRDFMAPDLKIYVEYSNEVWAGNSPQGQYAEKMGKLAGFGVGRPAIDGYYLRRSVEIFKIFESVFAQTGRQGLVKVHATQFNEYFVPKFIDWVDPGSGLRPFLAADVFAVAPYFCGGIPKAPTSVTQILDLCEASVTSVINKAKKLKAVVAKAGIPLITYEGGQHITFPSATANAQNIYNLANDSPRMGQLYSTYLSEWKNTVGGDLFSIYSYVGDQSKWGRWGILTAQDQTSYPKYDACIDFIDKNPIWWNY